MCKNCDIINHTFQGAASNPHQNLFPVYTMLLTLKQSNRIEVYAGDCAFEDMMQVLGEETHYTVCFYLRCPDCDTYYFLGACIRGTPIYKVIDDISQEKIEHLIWGREGVYFEQK